MSAPAAIRAIGGALALLTHAVCAHAQQTVTWEAFAIRYATLPNFRVSGLIAGADTSRRLDIAMAVWLLKSSDGRNVLVDAGFKREDLLARWKPLGYMRPDSAVTLAGVRADQISDVIISHVHWDHFDGADLFPNARIWIQQDEVEHHLDANGRSRDRALDGPDATMLDGLRRAGRVQLVNGDAQEILPGITAYIGGKHTFQSQYVGVRSTQGTIIIASDNMYLYENFERHVPIAQTLDAASNLAAHARMVTLAASPRLVIPGHDPLVFARFDRVSPTVVRLR